MVPNGGYAFFQSKNMDIDQEVWSLFSKSQVGNGKRIYSRAHKINWPFSTPLRSKPEFISLHRLLEHTLDLIHTSYR